MESNYTIRHIASFLAAESILLNVESFLVQPDTEIESLIIDSRSIINPDNALFCALMAQRDGHEYIEDAYLLGIRNFLISDKKYVERYPDANFLLVENVRLALQSLGKYKRQLYDIPVIAITGSNGKTMVKEWLYQLLAHDYNIARSPRSYNSQIGVPLSLWQLNEEHTLGIFEAGISKNEEMQVLADIIQPTIGILTNIGEAHAEGFSSSKEKLLEKLKLFNASEIFIYSPEYTQGIPEKELPGQRKFSWSTKQKADLKVSFMEPIEDRTYIRAVYNDIEIECLLPFRDKASVENGIICWATLLALGYSPEKADQRLEKLIRINMRLELKTGINQCSIIDDSYSADISSLAIALDFLNLQNQHLKKTLILSDLFETGKSEEALYEEIASLIKQKQVNRLIGIGPHISDFAALFDLDAQFYVSTQAFIDDFPGQHFANETILVKGARKFEFERISKLLTQKIHDTVMEINLNALASNLRFYKYKLRKGVKVMAMVKAFSYGSGSFEIANVLQYHKVDYLAVAYTDEGIALRKAGITLPIMVMSPEPSAFEAIVKYKLEPELYNLDILQSFLDFLIDLAHPYPVHLKIDTGMHRLGFEETEITDLLITLKTADKFKVMSVFSHLVGSDEELHDEFSQHQIDRFLEITERIEMELGYKFIRHIANTAAITRFPAAQLDMVRLGIGLYGFDAGLPHSRGLHTVAILKTTVTQIKKLKSTETIGYGRQGALAEGGTIATVKIGYADGYRRDFGHGVGKMLIHGKIVPTVGSICMDMCMLDVSGIDVKNGDEVIVFNDQLTIADLAKQINTIPYEILTNISQRVKRIYYYE
ncbi:bifunctional UDP-N-acetylmuramoyl-tripeptide:D-alanyl-D-alanine ligase/alanine racemase [Pedobacter immunditicola]|uniref:bifunctional UDP-N-acetylmuramoyl-tripeptide:D-alanyl-D-alanine ligase/alanine racemase n=1 Tax=Pedobacter immunditicola TaxID=3133440 RepID=UPI0030A4E091